MEPGIKRERYRRVAAQLAELLAKTGDPTARMATIAATSSRRRSLAVDAPGAPATSP